MAARLNPRTNRIAFRRPQRRLVVQGEIGAVFRGKCPEQGSFARLSRTGDENHPGVGESGLNGVGDEARIHDNPLIRDEGFHHDDQRGCGQRL